MPKEKHLSAEDILGVEDLEIVEVQVPEWKGSVYLRVLSADVGLALNEKMAALTDGHKTDALFLLLGACLVTPDGRPLFATEAQTERLRTRSQKVLLRLQKHALALQGWDVEPAKNG